MTKRLFTALLAAGLMAALFITPAQGKKSFAKKPAWGGLDSPLRPGAGMGYCTYNFVYYTPGTAKAAPKAYIGTAAHCTDTLGERMSHPELGEIGTVVYDSDLVQSPVDFTLVELDPAIVSQTNPTVFHWGGPTRVINEEDLAFGEEIDVYGYGVGVGINEATRPRSGYLVGFTEDEYQADMPAVNGDSGAPLLHKQSGAALGIISRYGIEGVPPSTDMGPLMPWILEELGKAGFNVRLAMETE